MVKLKIDNQEIEVAPGSTVLQACEQAGREIPRFCYHERLSIAGNCRMCLVEIEKAPKPIASCAYPIAEGMSVFTDTPMVRAARRGVMEFLLINHPLDCPICDQGGECDLQDQSMAYGMDHSRFRENKRSVKDKYLGPLVKTIMTRCIQCTRCIRFASEVAGVPELGATARGENMEVTTYVERALTSELSGNLIDICPVGALTSKPYAFVARSWELAKIESIDVLDALGAPIRIDARGPDVLRILPRTDDTLNEEWLADKSRFAVDGLKRRRLDRPWIRRDGRLQPASWPEALALVAAHVPNRSVGAVAGDLADAESMFALRELLAALGSDRTECRQRGEAIDPGRRDFYLFNPGVIGIDDADAILLVGSNPRHEAPVLNARIRKRWLAAGIPVGAIGTQADLTYPATHLGDSAAALHALADPAHPFAQTLHAAHRPLIVVGQGALVRADGAAIAAAAWQLAAAAGALTPEWHGYAMLHTAAARVGGLDLGFVHPRGLDAVLDVETLWLLGADELEISRIRDETFVIYQGHHGDRGAARADVILPGAAYTEKDATYVNTEGRVQRAYRVVLPPGEAREDWRILRAVSDAVGNPLPFGTLDALRARMEAAHPTFARQGLVRFGFSGAGSPAGDPQAIVDLPMAPLIADYYRTDPISRASATMAECSRVLRAPVAVAAE